MEFVIMKGQAKDEFRLVQREHDLGGVDYQTILRLTPEQALSIAGAHTGIDFLYSAPTIYGNFLAKDIRIERVADRQPNTRAWVMRIGEDLVTGVKDGVAVPLRLQDVTVENLSRHARVLFEPGQPDWDLRDVEDIEDKVANMREQLAELEARAQVKRTAYEAKISEPTSPEI